MSYTTTAGPKSGPIRWSVLAHSIGVLEGAHLMPCGIAVPITWDDQRRTLFTLIIRGQELPGRWAVVDRAFVEVGP